MCGIAGLVARHSPAQAAATLDKMLGAIAHRGPDGSGTFIQSFADTTLAMGMRRLAIVDIGGGDQPIASPSGQQIVMNGEIYNFRALRDALPDYPFKTRSDTESALASFMQKGLRAVQDWQGMFAMAIFDPLAGKLYLVRDRFGKKPLYYGFVNGAFWFGSEIKSLIAGMDATPAVNREAMNDFLDFRYVPSPETIWKDIYKLPPGSILTLDLATLGNSIQTYWRPAIDAMPVHDNAVEDAFTMLFHDAVQKRLLSADVPVGILLSGGLDSSAVAAAAKEMGHRELNSYSVHFDHPAAFNEKPFADQMARHVGTNHHTLMLTVDDFKNDLPHLVEMTDEPLADLATIPLFRICERARADVKVLLSGEGSDEILAGYHYDKTARTMDRVRFLARVMPDALLGMMPSGLLRRVARVGMAGLAADQASFPTRIDPVSARALARVRAEYAACPSSDPLEQMQQIMLGGWLVEDLLMKADKASMAASVELRCPFLDHDLAEFCFALPARWKTGSFTRGYTTKRLLRHYARRRLPQEIINRPKQGFPVPSTHWLRHDLSAWARDVLNDTGLDDVLPGTARDKIWREFTGGHDAHADYLWRLVILALWKRRWQA